MLLRRIKAHFDDENWFAIFLDFLIVVGGVGVALWAENLIKTKTIERDVARLEETLNQERIFIYINAVERISLSECRKQRIAALAEPLIDGDLSWEGMPLPTALSMGLGTQLPAAWSEPIKRFPTHTWDAAVEQGLTVSMDVDRANLLRSLYAAVEALIEFQNQSNALAMRIQPLALSLEMTPETQTQFISLLSELDYNSAVAELAAMQVKALVEAVGLDLTDEERALLKSQLDVSNLQANQLFGDCYAPISTAFLDVD